MKKIIAGDKVKVICGADKGKIGVVQSVKFCANRFLLVVSGVNVKKCKKRDSSGTVSFKSAEFPIDSSNVSAVCGENDSLSRVGFKFCDGKKRRYFKKTGVLI